LRVDFLGYLIVQGSESLATAVEQHVIIFGEGIGTAGSAAKET
jgi:hypothetical protein